MTSTIGGGGRQQTSAVYFRRPLSTVITEDDRDIDLASDGMSPTRTSDIEVSYGENLPSLEA